MLDPGLRGILVCPVCRGDLEFAPDEVRCKGCNQEYPVREGVPVLIPPDSPFGGEPLPPKRKPRPVSGPALLFRRYKRFDPPLTTWIDRSLYRHLNQCTEDMRILNLGSGVGQFDANVGSHLNLVNLDVEVRSHVDVLGDAHRLPFADESLDGVYSNAVLEHVQRPWLVADEIHRVLRPGGRIFIDVPFLNVIHAEHDYFRFTDRGLDVLFSRFEKLDGGVSAGPSSFAGPFLVEYLLCFLPGRAARKLARPLLRALAWPLKYLDFLIRRSASLRLTADAFYFVGVKRGPA